MLSKVMQNEILDYLPLEDPQSASFSRKIRILHRFLVFNFWHFIFCYFSFVLRVYMHFGHLPMYKHPNPATDFPEHISWSIHQNWTDISIAIVFFSSWIWLILNVANIFVFLRKKKIIFIDWIILGILGALVSYWLFVESSFGIQWWYFD